MNEPYLGLFNSWTGSNCCLNFDIDTLTTLVVAEWKDIVGEIPACEIPVDVGKLSRLTVLNLTDNALNGKIPASITRLDSLKHLDLGNNQLCSEIPKDFGNLVMLSCMLLSQNQLTDMLLRESYGEYVWLREGERELVCAEEF